MNLCPKCNGFLVRVDVYEDIPTGAPSLPSGALIAGNISRTMNRLKSTGKKRARHSHGPFP